MARASWYGVYLGTQNVEKTWLQNLFVYISHINAKIFVAIPVYAAGGSVRFWSKTPPVGQRSHSKDRRVTPNPNHHHTSVAGWEFITYGNEDCMSKYFYEKRIWLVKVTNWSACMTLLTQVGTVGIILISYPTETEGRNYLVFQAPATP